HPRRGGAVGRPGRARQRGQVPRGGQAAGRGQGLHRAGRRRGQLPVQRVMRDGTSPDPAGGASAPASPAGWPAIDDSFIEAQTATLNFSLGTPARVWVAPDGGAVLFTRSGPRSFESALYALDTASGEV